MTTIVSDFDIYNLSSSVVTNVSENSTNISTDVNLIVKDLVNNYLETKKVVIDDCILDNCSIKEIVNCAYNFTIDNTLISSTILSYLEGIDSNIQEQLDNIEKQIKTLNQAIPPGTIIDFIGTGPGVLQSGFLVCDGQQYSKTAYSKLYQAIGDVFNQSSMQTDILQTGNFRVPDFRGCFTRGTTYDQTINQQFFNQNNLYQSTVSFKTKNVNGRRYVGTIVDHTHQYTPPQIFSTTTYTDPPPGPIYELMTPTNDETITLTSYTKKADGSSLLTVEGNTSLTDNTPPHIITIKFIKF